MKDFHLLNLSIILSAKNNGVESLYEMALSIPRTSSFPIPPGVPNTPAWSALNFPKQTSFIFRYPYFTHIAPSAQNIPHTLIPSKHVIIFQNISNTLILMCA